MLRTLGGHMRHLNRTPLRSLVIALAAASATFAVTMGLPIKKSSAASADNGKSDSGRPGAGQPHAGGGSSSVGVGIDISSLFTGKQKPRQVVVQPVPINPTAAHLVRIATQALMDSSLAEHIYREPGMVAAQNNLNELETKVLKQMTAEQFSTAREDAARIAAKRLADASDRSQPTQEEVFAIAGRMVVGRSILAAVGRSYLDAADAHACCPWNKSIQIGLNSDPAMYNSVFAR
jgi:hypothetical protein